VLAKQHNTTPDDARMVKLAASTIKAYDSSGNGKVSLEEALQSAASVQSLQAAMGDTHTVSEFLQQVDTNSDSHIEMSEYMNAAATFNRKTSPSVKKTATLSAQQQLGLALAGMTAGVGGRTVTAPVERIKTLAQIGKAQEGAWPMLTHIMRTEGVYGLFRGNLANCLKVAPQKGMKFLGYENLKYLLCSNPLRPTAAEDFSCSIAMGCIALIVTYPLDTLKTRMSVSEKGQTLRGAFSQLYKEGGIPRLFSGISPALLSAAPFNGISITVFMQGKLLYKEYNSVSPLQPPPLSVMLGLSALSTFLAQLVSYPLYTIKCNMQNAAFSSPWSCGKYLVQERGVRRGLYPGVGLSALKALPNVAASFVIYEWAKSLLQISS